MTAANATTREILPDNIKMAMTATHTLVVRYERFEPVPFTNRVLAVCSVVKRIGRIEGKTEGDGGGVIRSIR